MTKEKQIIWPEDEYNQTLISHVHPEDWVNPQPADRYDLVVIGAGTAGLVVAAGAAGLGLGLKIALIEKHLMGGDCLNVGCVPSKSIIRSSRVVGELLKASSLGVNIKDAEVDFAAVMARMRRLRAKISPHDSAQRFQKLGIDVFFGSASFVDSETIAVNGEKLRFKKAVIATGARATKPPIEGLETAGYLTNETVFSLTEKPQCLAVMGGGPIGCELAQAFKRLGCEVILFHKGDRLLPKEDIEAGEILQNSFIKEGIKVVLNAQIHKVLPSSQGKTIYFSSQGKSDSIEVSEILVGAGRTPNVDGLNLEIVGVDYNSRKGVIVNGYLQTTNSKIYAAGDICLDWKFTHTADAAARIVIKNTLFSPMGLGRAKISDLIIPWVTYSDPEIAHVGLSQEQAIAKGIKFNVIKIGLETVDRAITDGVESGFVKILHREGSDEILGATIVAPHAGEMISEITTAMVGKLGLNTLSKVIHPYPTQAEGIKKAADAYRRSLLTANTQRLLKFLSKFS